MCSLLTLFLPYSFLFVLVFQKTILQIKVKLVLRRRGLKLLLTMLVTSYCLPTIYSLLRSLVLFPLWFSQFFQNAITITNGYVEGVFITNNLAWKLNYEVIKFYSSKLVILHDIRLEKLKNIKIKLRLL